MAAAVFGTDIYFFGGVGANTGTESILDVSNELWCFSTTNFNWREISRTGDWPSPRRCIGWCAGTEGIWLWGGSGLKTNDVGAFTYSFLNDLWFFDPTTSKWKEIEPTDDHMQCPIEFSVRPPPRYTPVFYFHNGTFILYGGYTEDRLGKRKMNDLWVRNRVGTWLNVGQNEKQQNNNSMWPGLRYGCMSTGTDNVLLICGGFCDDGDLIDIWALDCNTHEWKLLAYNDEGPCVPEKRYCAAMSQYENHVYLFGGRSRRYPKLNFNDLWRFSLIDRRWERISENARTYNYSESAHYPGYHAKSAIASIPPFFYLWGGEGVSGHVSDFWRFDMRNMKWQLIQAARHDDPILW